MDGKYKIPDLIMNLNHNKLKKIMIWEESGKYKGKIELIDPSIKLSEDDLRNVLKEVLIKINGFSENFTKSINRAFSQK